MAAQPQQHRSPEPPRYFLERPLIESKQGRMASFRKDIIAKAPQQRVRASALISVRFIPSCFLKSWRNVITLWMTKTARGVFPIWLTYKKAREFVAQVRKGDGVICARNQYRPR
jgi:hypothetical protein